MCSQSSNTCKYRQKNYMQSHWNKQSIPGVCIRW